MKRDNEINKALAEIKIEIDFFIIFAYNISGRCEHLNSHLEHYFFLTTAIIAVIVVAIAHTEVIHSYTDNAFSPFFNSVSSSLTVIIL